MSTDTPSVPVEGQVEWGDQLAYAVSTDERAASSYSSRTTYVDYLAPTQALGYDPDRARALLRNVSSFPMFIGTFSDVVAGAGYVLPAGQVHEVFVQGEVYVQAAADGQTPVTSNQPLSIWSESNR